LFNFVVQQGEHKKKCANMIPKPFVLMLLLCAFAVKNDTFAP